MRANGNLSLRARILREGTILSQTITEWSSRGQESQSEFRYTNEGGSVFGTGRNEKAPMLRWLA
jgi:hypothetical protein